MSPAVPRVRHVFPTGPVVRAPEPIPVVVLISWHDGRHTTEDGLALAWTGAEVLVTWTTPWGLPHDVWVPADHVQRRRPQSRA